MARQFYDTPTVNTIRWRSPSMQTENMLHTCNVVTMLTCVCFMNTVSHTSHKPRFHDFHVMYSFVNSPKKMTEHEDLFLLNYIKDSSKLS